MDSEQSLENIAGHVDSIIINPRPKEKRSVIKGHITLDVKHILDEVDKERRKIALLNIFEKCLGSKSEIVRRHAAGNLKEIAEIDSEKYKAYLYQCFNDTADGVKEQVCSSIAPLLVINPALFEFFFDSGMAHFDQSSCNTALLNLTKLSRVNYNKYFQICTDVMKSQSNANKTAVVYCLRPMAERDLETYIALLEQAINSKIPQIEHFATSQLVGEYLEKTEEGYWTPVYRSIVAERKPEKYLELFGKIVESGNLQALNYGLRAMPESIKQVFSDQYVDLLEKASRLYLKTTELGYHIGWTYSCILPIAANYAQTHTEKFIQILNNGMFSNVPELQSLALDYVTYFPEEKSDLVYEYLTMGMNSENIAVRNNTIMQAPKLISKHTALFSRLIKQALESGNVMLQTIAVNHIKALPFEDVEKNLRFVENAMIRTNHDPDTISGAHAIFKRMVGTGPGKASLEDLYATVCNLGCHPYLKEQLMDSIIDSWKDTAPAKYLSTIEKELASTQIDEQIKGWNRAAALADNTPEKYLEFLKKGITKCSEGFECSDMRLLTPPNNEYSEKYLNFLLAVLSSKNFRLQKTAMERLRKFSQTNPEKCGSFLQNMDKKSSYWIRLEVAEILVETGMTPSEKYTTIFWKKLQKAKSEEHLTLLSKLKIVPNLDLVSYLQILDWFLNQNNKKLSEKVVDKTIQFLKDDNLHTLSYDKKEKKFIKKFLSSRFVHIDSDRNKDYKTDETIISELKELVRDPVNNYDTMEKLMTSDRIRSLDELVACGKLSTPYEVLGYIGGGAFGKVFHVLERDMQDDRALKVIDEEKANPAELRIYGKLKKNPHRNFPFVYGKSHGTAYAGKPVYAIVMDYIEGIDLNRRYDALLGYIGVADTLEWSAMEAPTDSADICAANYIMDWAGQLLDAASHMSDLEIFHRDVRPENILLTKEGRIKILDFGNATDEPEAKPKDARRYGGPTDFFSIGLVLYKICTGNHLVLSRNEERYTHLSSQSYADIISQKKKEILTKKGKLSQKYRKKINAALKKEFKELKLNELIENCLISNIEYLSEYRQFYQTDKIRQELRVQLEALSEWDRKSVWYG